jgi:hypothetical protein
VKCYGCGAHSDVREYFDRALKWFPAIRALRTSCPKCSSEAELRVDGGEVAVGYSYGAGAWHFAAVEYTKVPDLLKSIDGDKFHIELDDREWFVPVVR